MQQLRHLPEPSLLFAEKKAKILEQLAVPEAEYTDLSPKGTVDKGIRHLIDEINSTDGFVTTSSCAGRVSVFLEGRKAPIAADAVTDTDGDERTSSQVAGVGGKGAGGAWLFVSHDPVPDEDWVQTLEFVEGDASQQQGVRRLIHFKFEPMVRRNHILKRRRKRTIELMLGKQILHVLTASLTHAQLLLRSALQAGFRESGAINITSTESQPTTPIVAVRSMGLSFESLIGYESNGQRYPLVTESYLRTLMDIGNERFSENTKRIERFRVAFKESLTPKMGKMNPEGREWEDPVARRERMRAEGLQRKAMKADLVAEEKMEAEDEMYGIP